MVFCPSRHTLLSSRVWSKRLLRAALSSVRGQSNFPTNHPQFLTLLRALKTCGPSSFVYGSVSSCPSGAFVVDCLQLSLHFLYTQLQLAAELRSGLSCTCIWSNTPRNTQESSSACAGPKRNKAFYTSSRGKQGRKPRELELLRRDSPEAKMCEHITWCRHPCTSVNTGSAAVTHCSISRRNIDPWEGVPELTWCHRIWLSGVNVAVLCSPHT